MKSTNASSGSVNAAEPNHPARISERKLKANRENARKSTGPKTPRGKAFSSKNAIKHGLFIRDSDESLEEEDPRDFHEFYRRLRAEIQPVGPSEENVVQYIAIAWQRLERLYRYENAKIESKRAHVSENKDDFMYYRSIGSRRIHQLLSTLRSAEKEVEASGQISPESMKTISEDWQLHFTWPHHQAAAEKKAKRQRQELAKSIAESRKIPPSEARQLLSRGPKSLPEYVRFVTLETVRAASGDLMEVLRREVERRTKIEYEKCLVPDANEIDKIIRYQNAIEKQVSRGYQWLYTLQQLRLGKSGPASLGSGPTRRRPRRRSAPAGVPSPLFPRQGEMPDAPARLI